MLCSNLFFLGEDRVVMVPPFAESVSEGDVRWERGIIIFVILTLFYIF